MIKRMIKKALLASGLIIFTIAVVAVAGIFILNAMVTQPEQRDISREDRPTHNLDLDFDVLRPEDREPGVLHSIDPPQEFGMWERREHFYTFMIIGTDERRIADVIIIASYNVATHEANLVFIPRDMKVRPDLAERGDNVFRINGAYPSGRRFGGGDEGGITQMLREVETIIGFEPDYYVTIGLVAFMRIIDALGGVDIHVPFRMVYSDPAQHLFINLHPGTQRLDGNNTLGFVRYRQGMPGDPNATRQISDVQRNEHQRMVIEAVAQRARTIGLSQITTIIGNMLSNVRTNMELNDIIWFATEYLNNSSRITIRSESLPYTVESRPIWYAIPHAEPVLEVLNRTVNPFMRDLTPDDLQLVTQE